MKQSDEEILTILKETFRSKTGEVRKGHSALKSLESTETGSDLVKPGY